MSILIVWPKAPFLVSVGLYALFPLTGLFLKHDRLLAKNR
jgi:hypothetical protein